MLYYSYHNHTRWSDGQADMEAMGVAAKQAGLREFGLSDHLAFPPPEVRGTERWSLPFDRIDEYIAMFQDLKSRLDDATFTLRLGVEVEFFPETVEHAVASLRPYPFDYLIGGIHYVGTFAIDSKPAPWEELDQAGIDRQWRLYWQNLLAMINTRHFDFIAHLDLPKKFNFLPQEEYVDLEEEVLQALHRTDTPIELNTAGWAKPCADCYPNARLLKRAAQLGLPILVNADAHETGHVNRFFPEAETLLRELGFADTCRFEQRRRFSVPLGHRH